MRNAFRFLLALVLAAPAFAQTDIGVVDVKGGDTISVSVTSSSPELLALAQLAFNTHGRLRLVASGGSYEVGLQPAGASAVSVTVSRSGSAVLTQTVPGTSARNALLKAA